MKRLPINLLYLLVFEILLTGINYSANTNIVTGAPSRSTISENEFALAINNHRQSLGLSRLCVSTTMTSAAVSWTRTMATNEDLSHAPDITTGLPAGQWRSAAENVGRGGTVTSLMNAFLNSPDHRANIENASSTHIGVGVYITDNNVMYTTHRFADIIGSIPCSYPTETCSPPSAGENTTASITSSSANLLSSAAGSWFDWRYKRSTSSTWIGVSASSTGSRTISGLTASTSYQWQSKRRCSNNIFSDWSSTDSFTTSAAPSCSAPSLSQNSTASITNTSASLRTSATGNLYDWRYKRSTSSTWTNVNNTTTSMRTITGLTASTNYQWQSKRRCTNSVISAWSATESFTTSAPVNACSAPTTSQNTTAIITSSSANLRTSASGNLYDWRYRKSTTSAWTDVSWSSVTNKTINGLTASTQYQWQSKRRCNNNVISDWSLSDTFTTSAAAATCSAPTTSQNTSASIASSSANLRTSASGSLYDWRYRKSTTSSWTNVNSTSSANKVITGLSASTEYQWQSNRRCSNNITSSWSTTETFTTADAALTCSAPTNGHNTTVSVTSSSANLRTSAIGNLYDWRYRNAASSSWTDVNYTTAANRTISGLTESTEYRWQSRRRCTNNVMSAWSSTESFSTLAAPSTCSAPMLSQNTTSAINSTSATMQTSAPGSLYDWRYKRSTSNTWINLNLTTSATKTITRLIANTRYHWQSKRRCTNSVYSSWSATETFITSAVAVACTPPTASQNYTKYIGPNTAQLVTSNSVNQYDWRYRRNNTGIWTDIDATSSPRIYITGLAPGAIYFWQSKRRCSDNNSWSAWSGNETFTTGVAGCNAASKIRMNAVNVTESSATLSTTLDYGLEYEWRYRESFSGEWDRTVSSQTNSLAISNLRSNLYHSWSLRIKCSNGWSGWSNYDTFRTLSSTAGLTESETRRNSIMDDNNDHIIGLDDITIYPNPASRFIIIDIKDKVKSKSTCQISIFNNAGLMIRNYSDVTTKTMNIDLAGFVPGVYHVRITDANEFITKKFVVNN